MEQQTSWTAAPCWLGWVAVGASDEGITDIHIGTSAELAMLASRSTGEASPGGLATEVATWLAQPSASKLKLDIQGTDFQKRVWAHLSAIPEGTTQSYAEVANALGAPEAVRAVAGAVASNRLAVVIPCHRVVRSDGGLAGFRWGVDRKRKLLVREGALPGQDQLAMF
jgi:AraC family transcriptional regulator of adaptative response/methylated-DNA-[protein]-cysteine methyltransferase